MSRSVFGQSKLGSALRILIVDPHNMYRAGLRTFIAGRMPDAEIVDSSDLAEGLSKARVMDPIHLVLIDLDPSSFGSLDLLKQAFKVSSKMRFAIISDLDTHQRILASLAAGFHGFISKHQFDDDILNAIKDIASGRIYVPPSLARAEHADAITELRGETPPAMFIKDDTDLLGLTPRQREVLSYLALGMSNKEIARALHIAEATTKVHAAALLRTLGARNRTEAAFKAGKLLQALNSCPPLSPAAAVREDGHTLPLRLIKTKPAIQATRMRIRRKSPLD